MAQAVTKARTLSCPACGGNVEIRGFAHTRSAVCIQCLSVLDTSTPEVAILQRFEERIRVQPLLPLGKRGKVHNTAYEVIGFQVRTITADVVDYSWHEYLLFNPYQGFRYFTQYNGHWCDVVTLPELPAFTTSGGRKAVRRGGTTYKHFQTAMATTTFVMGEFPWQVHVGEQIQVEDFIAPPYLLSAEVTDSEITWSLAEYMTGAAVWQTFQLPGAPPAAKGVYANQPAPASTAVASIWGAFFKLFLAWVVLLFAVRLISANHQVMNSPITLANHQQVVTGAFDLTGRSSNTEVELRTNGYGYYHMALVNVATGRATEFARNVAERDRVTLPRVPAGRYYVRVDPEIDSNRELQGQISIWRDVPHTLWLWLALPMLLIPPLFSSARRGSFESARWQESDYA